MPEATVSITVTYQAVESPADLVEALEQALPRGYFGTITAMKPDEETTRWVLVMNTLTNTAEVQVRLGDYLLWDGSTYQSLNATQFAERFGGS